MNQSNALILWLQAFSPTIIAVGVIWKVGHWWVLRSKQKRAIVDICESLEKLPDPGQTFYATRALNELKAKIAFYEKVVFGSRIPLCLMKEIVEMNALIEGAISEWETYCRRELTLSREQGDIFTKYRESARSLKDKARIVLYSL